MGPCAAGTHRGRSLCQVPVSSNTATLALWELARGPPAGLWRHLEGQLRLSGRRCQAPAQTRVPTSLTADARGAPSAGTQQQAPCTTWGSSDRAVHTRDSTVSFKTASHVKVITETFTKSQLSSVSPEFEIFIKTM